MSLFARLKGAMNRHPYIGPILSAGILTFAGDAIAQQIVERKERRPHDWRRTAFQTLYGFLLVGPSVCIWYRVMDRHIVHQNRLVQTARRVAIDQLVMSPIFLAIYFAYNAAVDGSLRGHFWRKMDSGYLRALLTGYAIWPAVQCINFSVVPLNLRVAFVNCISVGWSAYLSHLNAGTSPLRPRRQDGAEGGAGQEEVTTS